MRIYLHQPVGGPDDVEVIEDVAPAATIRELLKVEEEFVFIDEDGDVLDVERTWEVVLTERGEAHHHHVHKHHCAKIDVQVTYAGVTRTLRLVPSTKIEKVRAEAVNVFGIGSVDATPLVLRLASDASTDLKATLFLSDLPIGDTCTLAVNLVASSREAG